MDTKFYTQGMDYKYTVKPGYLFRVTWKSIDGRYYTDFFVSLNTKRYSTYDVSYVHKCSDIEKSLREYLSHLPLHSVTITIEED